MVMELEIKKLHEEQRDNYHKLVNLLKRSEILEDNDKKLMTKCMENMEERALCMR